MLTTADIARELSMSPAWVRAQCHRGIIRARRIGGRWRVTREALADYLGDDRPATREAYERERERELTELETLGGNFAAARFNRSART